ncbi:hypothetical protein C8R47DRAFT_1095280 [Mycena vitilis]|nr:hypothetical protein C8R47DRAFT_1095280 [Mycena vitilis]
MYPDGRTNPAPAHFARNTPVEMHPPLSPRLLKQRHLDREGRAICRIVYAHGIGVQNIANVFCVSEDTVSQAIENKPTEKGQDREENDYWYVSNEYRNQYPSISQAGYHRAEVDSQAQKGHPKVSERDKSVIIKVQSSSERARSGTHRSDSGQPVVWIQNPSAHHFKEDIPVVPADGTNGRLDRKGRAICRIMHPYLGNYTKIANIFGITHTRIRRAVLNDYSPSDDVTEDYDYAGKDFKDEYPPRLKKFHGHSQPAGKRSRSPELDDVIVKRTKKDQATNPPAKLVARNTPVIELTPRPKADPGAVGMRSFLKNIGGFDLSHWQETFKEKGLYNMGDLATLACLEESRLVKTLTRLFADKKMAEVHILLLADALLDLAEEVV